MASVKPAAGPAHCGCPGSRARDPTHRSCRSAASPEYPGSDAAEAEPTIRFMQKLGLRITAVASGARQVRVVAR